MPKDKKKKIMHKFRMKEISAVDGMAQGGAKMVLMKRDTDDGEALAKTMFDEALDSLELEEDIDEATRDMWQYNAALRNSIRSIMEDKETYPDTMAAIRMSLQEFVSAVSSMIEGAVGEIEDDAEAITKENPTKTEGGKKFPAGDYAYVPDPKKPSTWKLRLTSAPGGDPDKRIVGAAVAALGPGFRGQKVQIPSDDLAGVIARVRSAWLKANPDKDKKDLPKVLKAKEASAMPKPEDKKTTEELEKSIEEKDLELKKVQEELEVVKAVSALTDAEKSHYNTLEDEDKASFLKLDADGRSKVLEKLAAKDSVVYTDDKGTEYKKSDDPRLVQMAKDADADRTLAKTERGAREKVELEKRADTELKNLPGEQAVKVAVLKAVDGIEDEEVRKSAHELLKAGNDSLEKSFEEIGSRGEGFKKASDELDALAKKHAEDHKVSYNVAYDEVLKTDKGAELYEQTLPQSQIEHQG
jgi:hypothetical protein